jgi:hypothetical protein
MVGSVDFTQSANPAVDNFSTGTLSISGVPPNADILAAYLYWETIHLSNVSNPHLGVEFDGRNVNDPDIPLVKASAEVPLFGGACYGSGNASYELTMMKADVLRLLPFQKDSRGVATGKRLVTRSSCQTQETGTILLKARGPRCSWSIAIPKPTER